MVYGSDAMARAHHATAGTFSASERLRAARRATNSWTVMVALKAQSAMPNTGVIALNARRPLPRAPS
jgi:hypothetical protein